MKKIKIIFWITTGLLAALMTFSGISNLLSVPDAITLFKHLGYPPYLSPFLGLAKILGVIAIVVPGFPRLKEWAYAGFVFDLTGALYSGIMVDGPDIFGMIFFVIIYIVLAISYIYHHKKQKTATLAHA